MHPSVLALFRYVRPQVTAQDIKDYCPSDPGYGDYVAAWTDIWESQVLPRASRFDLSEVISLTGFADAGTRESPDRFRRFRRFTTTVAIALIHQRCCVMSVRAANYLARELLIDFDLKDRAHLSRLRPVFESTRAVLKAAPDGEEYPFFTLGSMILAQKASDWSASEAAATQLIVDEWAIRSDFEWWEDQRFLLGLTVFDQHHSDWLALALDLINPTGHEDTALVLDALIPTEARPTRRQKGPRGRDLQR